jgi:hypothetical protein
VPMGPMLGREKPIFMAHPRIEDGAYLTTIGPQSPTYDLEGQLLARRTIPQYAIALEILGLVAD